MDFSNSLLGDLTVGCCGGVKHSLMCSTAQEKQQQQHNCIRCSLVILTASQVKHFGNTSQDCSIQFSNS